MTVPREDHSATLLSDGRVLVVGGTDYPNGTQTLLASAEIYDPSTRAFSACGSMDAPRSGHTATELADGRVLIVGGDVLFVNSTQALLFDPKTCSFTRTGDTNFRRSGHTATLLLQNGKILVAGGAGTSSAELYDPSTGTFQLIPSGTDRSNHTASLMADGRVLLVGGVDSSGSATGTADIYDPASNSFTRIAAALMADRAQHTATILQNGSILVVGGTNAGSPPNALVSAEVYR
jgi:hypothetical protein